MENGSDVRRFYENWNIGDRGGWYCISGGDGWGWGEGVERAAQLVGWRDGLLAIGGVVGFGGCGAGADRGGSGAAVV